MGILKAGAVYLPIDASYPQSRIEHLIEDSKTSIIVTTTDLNINTTLLNDRMIVNIDLEPEFCENLHKNCWNFVKKQQKHAGIL